MNDTKVASIFYLGALGLAALLAMPLWIDPRGITAPYFKPMAIVIMWTPALASWLAWRREPAAASWRAVVGLRRPVRVWTSTLLAIALPLLFSLGSLAVGAALGVYELDLQLSGFGEKLEMPIQDPLITSTTLLLLVIPASFFNGLVALGEELGWRGYLHDKLQHLHPLRADTLIGLMWGLWHAPLVLLGYNYPAAPVLGAFVLMPGMCIPLAIWIGWLRRRSESVWVAALAHGATNAAATLGQGFYRAGSPPDAIHATMTGWSGWLLPITFAAWLASSGRIHQRVSHSR